MLIHNIEELIPTEKTYECTNKRENKFLLSQGLQFIAFKKKSWIYLETAELVHALEIWERRGTG